MTTDRVVRTECLKDQSPTHDIHQNNQFLEFFRDSRSMHICTKHIWIQNVYSTKQMNRIAVVEAQSNGTTDKQQKTRLLITQLTIDFLQFYSAITAKFVDSREYVSK